jgi:small subunit ribosomal protein S6
MRCYEHTLIARQDLSPQQAQALAETYSGVLTEHGGEVTKTEYWGLRSLSYRIRNNRKGHYLHLNVRASTEAIAELERQERLSDDVLRYLTVKVDALDEGPSILMQSRSSREERSRRPHDDEERPRRPHDDEERPRRARDDEERPRKARDDDERPRKARDDDERPRRARDDSARRAPEDTAEAKGNAGDDGAAGEDGN